MVYYSDDKSVGKDAIYLGGSKMKSMRVCVTN